MRALSPVVFAFAVAGMPVAIGAQPVPDAVGADPGATVADLAWLAGRWVGPGFDGVVEELWLEPAGGTMVGMARVVSGGRFVVLEPLLLEDEAGKLVYRWRHFGPGLEPWEEEPLVYRLERSGDEEAVFEALTRVEGRPHRIAYRRRGRSLEVTLEGWDGAEPIVLPMELR